MGPALYAAVQIAVWMLLLPFDNCAHGSGVLLVKRVPDDIRGNLGVI